MRPPEKLVRIVDRKRYSVESATLLAGNDWWDGHNFERNHRNQFLYRTAAGAYFTVSLSHWQGEDTILEPVTLDEAVEMFEDNLREHRVTYTEAFPGVEVTNA